MVVATLPAVKINGAGKPQPPKFSDKALTKTLGAIIGRLSDDDIQALAIRHAGVETALRIRQRWLAQIKSVADSSAGNAEAFKTVSSDPLCASVRDETLEFLHTDQQHLDRENLLAHTHVLLCDRVIAALTNPYAGRPPTSNYWAGGACDRAPLRHLQDSVAAVNRADRRIRTADGTWSSAIKALAAEAKARNAFANTSWSVSLDEIDALSGDTFEKQIAGLLERDDCRILRGHGGPNDHGADVIGLTAGGLRVVLQCKHSTKLRHRVDPKAVYELNGTARPEHGADIAGLVTNRTLSDTARNFAIRHQIHVIDRPVLQRWATYGVSWLPVSR